MMNNNDYVDDKNNNIIMHLCKYIKKIFNIFILLLSCFFLDFNYSSFLFFPDRDKNKNTRINRRVF